MEIPKNGRGPFHDKRRIVSAPPATSINAASDEPIETLYSHPNIHIISFSAKSTSKGLGNGTGLYESGSNSPSHIEKTIAKTIAVGSFRIYRAPGSVAFLSCGTALQPILPRSQCWSLDEAETVFLLQIRRCHFWRFEIARFDEGFREKSTALREVLKTVLQYEKTPCPLPRSFSVTLPDTTDTPDPATRKRPWTRKDSSTSQGSPANDSPWDFENRKTQLDLRDAGHRIGPVKAPSLYGEKVTQQDCTSDCEGGAADCLHMRSEDLLPLDPLAAEASHQTPVTEDIVGISAENDGSPNCPTRRAIPAARKTARSPNCDQMSSKHERAPAYHSASEVSTKDHEAMGQGRVPLPARRDMDQIKVPNIDVNNAEETSLVEPVRRVPPASLPTTTQEYPASEDLRHSIEASTLPMSGNMPALATERSSALDRTDVTSQGVPMLSCHKKRRATTCSSSPEPKNSQTQSPETGELSLGIPSPPADRTAAGSSGFAPHGFIGKTYHVLLAPPTYLIVLMLTVAAQLMAGERKGRPVGTDNNDNQISVRWDLSEEELSD